MAERSTEEDREEGSPEKRSTEGGSSKRIGG